MKNYFGLNLQDKEIDINLRVKDCCEILSNNVEFLFYIFNISNLLNILITFDSTSVKLQ